MLDVIVPLAGLSFVSITILIGLLYGLIGILGKIYATYRSLIRKDLTSEQRIIYLALIWFVPLGWLIYLLLGTERTQQLFSDVQIF